MKTLLSDDAEIKVPWSGRGLHYSEEEIDFVASVMRHADPLSQGKYQAEFEHNFSLYLDTQHTFAVSSCTSALELSAILSRIAPGDEVIVPAHTFAASAIPFARRGAQIVWADIDADSFVVTADTIAPLITDKTRAIVVVHLYGLVCDMDPIMQLAAKHGLLVIEDAAQSVGAEYKGKKSGTIGDYGCFSFHTHKNISTLGEGGMLCVKSAEQAEKVSGLRHLGMRAYPKDREKYWVPAMTDVDFDYDEEWPFNFCIGEVQCALGNLLIKRIDRINAERAYRAAKFISAFSSYEELQFQKIPDGCGHANHLLVARYNNRKGNTTRDDVIRLLAQKFGVKVVVQYCPLYRYPMFIKAGFGAANCPNTDIFFDNMISFPFHQWMEESVFMDMIGRVQQALDQARKLD